MTPATRRLALFAAATTALAVTACSSPLPASSGAQPAPATTTTIAGYQTPARTKGADLRAQLTALLVEHAYLLGRVTKQIAAAVPSSPTTTTATPAIGASLALIGDAATALDKNSRDLADLVSAAYPSDFNASFYGLWTKRIADFEAYAKAKASGGATSAATDGLAANAKDLATLFHNADKYIPIHTVSSPGTGLQDELTPDNTAVTDLIDAQVANDPAQITKQVAAAELLPHTAEVLAAAAGKLLPDSYPGTITGSAANLRASLTAVLVEHVELASIALIDITANADAGAAQAALDANGRQLANVFAAVYDDGAAANFLAQWRAHIGFFVDYAKAKAGADQAGAATAAAKLDDYSTSVGKFLAQATNGKLTAAAATEEFRAHVAGLLAVVDGATGRSPGETLLIRTAAGHMTDTASVLAEAIAEQFPAKYLP